MTPNTPNAEPNEPGAQLVWSSFLVRFCKDAQAGEWRGTVTHLQTRETRPLATLPQMLEFLARFAPGLENQKELPRSEL